MKKLNRWYPWIAMIGLLFLLAGGGRSYSAAQAPTAVRRTTFDFNRFTMGRPFILNTLPTTPYGPALG